MDHCVWNKVLINKMRNKFKSLPNQIDSELLANSTFTYYPKLIPDVSFFLVLMLLHHIFFTKSKFVHLYNLFKDNKLTSYLMGIIRSATAFKRDLSE